MGRITFTADSNFAKGEVEFNSAPAGREELREAGLAYYELAADGRWADCDQMLLDNGSAFIRRALQAFSRLAARCGEKAVAKAAMELRAEIPAHGKVEQVESQPKVRKQRKSAA